MPSRQKIMLILGTRPEFIKSYSPLIELKKRPEIDLFVVSTGQHRELAEQVISDLEIQIDMNLNLMFDNQPTVEFLAKSLIMLSEVISKQQPQVIIVQGDTTTTLSGSLAAFLSKVPIVHIESGCRSGSLTSPWPEEGIRRSVDALSNILFASSLEDYSNISPQKDQKVIHSGNTGVDSVIHILEKFKSTSRTVTEQNKKILISLHRREIHGSKLERILAALLECSKIMTDFKFSIIRHPNPSVSFAFDKVLTTDAIEVLNPLSFTKTILKLRESSLCLTDSGGLTLDAITVGTPVAIVRDTFEQNEVLETGMALLVGTSPIKLRNFLLNYNQSGWQSIISNNKKNPFGDGRSGARIAEEIVKFTLDSIKN